MRKANRMAADFDDHATVVVLEFLLTRLIARQCSEAPNPTTALAGWSAAVEEQKRLFEMLAFRRDTRPEVTANAIAAITEFDRIMRNISELAHQV